MTDEAPRPSAIPSRKVAYGGIAGALAAIICWASKAYGGAEIPAEIAVALTTLFTFALQYTVHDNSGDSL